ncbi:MAG: protein RecA [Patescibacteria group bacterium]|nr:MAG: protein RecA [Patescibacteria group bacterium]
MPDNYKTKAVQTALEQIQKQFGKGSIMRLGDKPKIKVDTISTGVLTVDSALGVGGLPRGRIIEVFGPESSGKTTLCLSAVAESQKKGGTAAFIDAEHALDPDWAEKIGVNINDLLISQPDTGEQALEIAETLIRSGGVDIIVIDSVAALVPRVEIEGEMGEMQIGLQARLMSQALRKLTAITAKSNAVVIFTNQIRLKVGVMFGNPETTPGGMALKFYSSIRMDIRKAETLKKDGDVYGAKIRVRVVKNKTAPPFKEAQFIITGAGIDKNFALIQLGVETGILEKSGSFIKYKGEVLGQGTSQVIDLLTKEQKKAKELEDQIRKKLFS